MPRKTINKKPVKKPKIDAKKKELMDALVSFMGNISASCESLGYKTNSVYYKYYDNCKAFRDHAEFCKSRRKDFYESKLDKLAEQESPTAILFFLKTQCKDRGYTERQELDIKTEQSIIWEEIKTYEAKPEANDGI